MPRREDADMPHWPVTLPRYAALGRDASIVIDVAARRMD